jgi:hypothetical protein
MGGLLRLRRKFGANEMRPDFTEFMSVLKEAGGRICAYFNGFLMICGC